MYNNILHIAYIDTVGHGRSFVSSYRLSLRLCTEAVSLNHKSYNWLTKGETVVTTLTSIGRTLGFFKWALLSTLLVLAAVAAFTRSSELLSITLLLAVLELGLSFDNAVVNALVLRTMAPKWQRYFLLWGILIAVFGMRLFVPVLIVAIFGGLAPWHAFTLAFTDGHHYGKILHGAHLEIAGFGGMFLAMVFLAFIMKKQEHTWLGPLERQLQKLGQFKSIEALLGLGLIGLVSMPTPNDKQLGITLAMLGGLVTFLLVNLLTDHMEKEENKKIVQLGARSGVTGFFYLEVLDASVSFDGVIGAFTLSTNVVVIMAGLGIGALCIRSMTVFLVRGGHLDTLPHLAHAAHYAIGALAVVMFVGMIVSVPEVLTGLVGVGFLATGWLTSHLHNRKYGTLSTSRV